MYLVIFHHYDTFSSLCKGSDISALSLRLHVLHKSVFVFKSTVFTFNLAECELCLIVFCQKTTRKSNILKSFLFIVICSTFCTRLSMEQSVAEKKQPTPDNNGNCLQGTSEHSHFCFLERLLAHLYLLGTACCGASKLMSSVCINSKALSSKC